MGDAGKMSIVNENTNNKGISVEPVSLLIGTALALTCKGRDKGVTKTRDAINEYLNIYEEV